MWAINRISKLQAVITGLLLTILLSCSPNQNSFTSNIYHNLTAHFNGYYYANEGILGVEQTITKSLDDDHNQLLQLFPKLDTTLAKTYSKETEEVIKMASISIQRHPNSKWVYKNYILVGLARLYACDYQNAIQTFKYVNTKSNEPNLKHRALIHLIRTFTEQGEYAKADETIDFLTNEKLTKENQKLFFLELAYLSQIRKDYDQMVQSLTKADPLLDKQDRRGRIYFIIGQVYQKIGFSSEAFNYYKKCLSTNPEYEIDFYARLNMAQVTSASDEDNSRDIRKQLFKMLDDDKNIEFKDKIYFEIGEFEFRQGDLPKAMENYRLSLRAGNSQRIKGNGYLRLGQIYYDSLKKFNLAKAYYDSAVNSLPPDTENLTSIKKLQEVLADFVEFTSTIQLQDSLLRLAEMDTAMLRKEFDSTRQIAEAALAAKKTKKARASSDNSNDRTTGTFYAEERTTTSDWYFGNLSAVSVGQTEFQRIWGTMKLEDNWRRSVKTSSVSDDLPVADGKTETPVSEQTATETKAAKADPFMELYQQLPITIEQKDSALAKIEKAYLKLGDLYYFRLEEKDNALITYKTLLQRFPKSRYTAEILYKLYLAAKETNNDDSEFYKSKLISDYPNTTYGRLLINPNYLAETTATIDKQKALYKQAYLNFTAGEFIASTRSLQDAFALGDTDFVPQVELLKIMITGKTEDVTRYQFELDEFIKKYPTNSLKPFAEKLRSASDEALKQIEKENGIRYIKDPLAPHQLVIVHQKSYNLSTVLVEKMDEFNGKNFRDKKLVVSNLVLDDEQTSTSVIGFQNQTEATEYLKQIKSQLLTSKQLVNYKFDIFVITSDNFGVLYRTKALREYLSFYDRNY